MNVKDELTETADDMDKFTQSRFPSSLNDAISLRTSEKNTVIRVDDKSECIPEQTLLKEEIKKIEVPKNDEDDYDDQLASWEKVMVNPAKRMLSGSVRPFTSPHYQEVKERILRIRKRDDGLKHISQDNEEMKEDMTDLNHMKIKRGLNGTYSRIVQEVQQKNTEREQKLECQTATETISTASRIVQERQQKNTETEEKECQTATETNDELKHMLQDIKDGMAGWKDLVRIETGLERAASRIVEEIQQKNTETKEKECQTAKETNKGSACQHCEQGTSAATSEQLLEEGKLQNMEAFQDVSFKDEQKPVDKGVCQKEEEHTSNFDHGILSTNQAQPKCHTMQSTTSSLAEHLSLMSYDQNGPFYKQIDDISDDKDSAWNDCIQSKNATKAKQLLKEGKLPNMNELQGAYVAFKDEQKALVKSLCQNVEEYISTIDDCIVYAQACYESNTPDKILFVVYTYDIKDRAICTGYPCHFRRTEECSEEGDEINSLEQQENLSFDNAVYRDLTLCLRMRSPELMEKHSNLISTSVSHFKSSKVQGLQRMPCIVLYVTQKGFIPVGEEALPTTLNANSKVFRTDIREGRDVSPSGGPTEEHKDLKIGCRIESSGLPGEGGTIGAFVDHPDHGLCAVTCAHVVLDISEFEQLWNKQKEVKDLVGKQCFQPEPPKMCGEVVDIRLFAGTGRKGGMDIAFIKVEDDRRPKTEEFPDIFKSDLKNKRSSCLDCLLMRKLEYSNHAVIQDQSELDESKPVVKYGSATNLTSGKRVISGISVKQQLMSNIQKKGKHSKLIRKTFKYCLHDQLEIQDDDGIEFSKGGDSGSMVFITDKNNKLISLGILTGREVGGKKSYATPIWNIFEEIQSPFPYSLADTSNPLNQIMERFDKHSGQISNLQKSLDDLNKGRVHNS